jgi:predicted ATPase/DNA-binding NarL/FixJ family response regulator
MGTLEFREPNIPSELTSFVGRRTELASAKRQLAQSRIVTLTGNGGVGKTRLAVRMALDLSDRFPDGAWLVDLAPLNDPGLVAQTIALTLGLRDESGHWTLPALTGYLRERALLMVLDNCEHVLDACAVVAEALLRGAPEVRIICTSRQPLGVPGEHVLPVPPLKTPGKEISAPDDLVTYEAAALFVERARASAPAFALTNENAAAVSVLVQRLDGIPLALELAAARMRVLSPQQVVERLSEGFGLLATSGPGRAAHQRSLQALIDWSYDLCTPEEQKLWARMSVFPGPFDLEAAEQICSGGGLEKYSVLGALVGLVDKSILGTESSGDRVRYQLLQTLREYGTARLLEAGMETELRRRHLDYYSRLGRRIWQEWFGPNQVELIALIRAEYLNLRSALEFGLTDGIGGQGLHVLPALSMYWWAVGSLDEGRRLLTRALTVVTEPASGRALLHCLLAWLALNQGDMDTVESQATECRKRSGGFGGRRSFGYATVSLGRAQMSRGDRAAAESYFHEALDSAGEDPVITAAALRGLGELAANGEEMDAAETWLSECVALCQEHGESSERGTALWTWALLTFRRGDAARATELARESLRLRATMPDRIGIAQCIEVLAWTAAQTGEAARAATLLGAADTSWRAVGANLYPDLIGIRAACAEQARRMLGDRAFHAATSEGTAMSRETIVTYAMGGQTAAVPEPRENNALTRREMEVAELVAAGLTNREIAARMTVAQRTAEGHVERILAKLGFTSRAQIAAWVASHRPPAGG